MNTVGIDKSDAAESFLAVSADDRQEYSLDLAILIQMLRSGKWLIVRGTLLAVVAATAIAFLLPVRYTSTTSFVPPTLGNNNSMATALAGQLSALGGGDLLGASKNSGDMYAGILRSRSIASELVKRLDLMREYKVRKESQAEKILKNSTVVSSDPKSSIVTVEVTARTPSLAHDLASAYMDELRNTNGRMALGQSSQRRLFFGQQLAREKDDLENAEVELKEVQEQSGLIAPTGQTEAEIKTLAEMQAQIAVREVQLASLRQSATDENPDVIRLKSEIGDLQGQLARMQRGNGSKSTVSIPTSKVPALQLEYLRKQREVKYHEALFEMLSRQYEAARLDEARDAPIVQVLDPASYPDTKSSPKRLYIIAGGMFFGLIASTFWVLARRRFQEFRASLAGA